MNFSEVASQLRIEAHENLQRVADSFEACDTDGFLSQWGNSIMARVKMFQADVVENGGVWPFPGLYRDGRRVRAKLLNGRYGPVWLLDDAEAAVLGRKFIPFCGNGTSKVQKSLGLYEALELATAKADTVGSDLCNVTAAILRTDNGWGDEATPPPW